MRRFLANQESPAYRQAGFTMIELVVFSSVLTCAILMTAPWIKNTIALQHGVSLTDLRGNALQATDVLVSDLKEAASTSLPWTSIPPQSTTNLTDLTFSKFTYGPDPN